MNPFAHFQALYGHLELSEDDAALHVFLSGWNTAMHEMMERVNKMPFGNDTRASFAVYFQSQMVDVGAIEKPTQQEPAYKVTIVDDQHPNGVPLEQWGRPAQRTWVWLTDKERNNLWREAVGWGDPSHDDEDLMKAIEDTSRKKNT